MSARQPQDPFWTLLGLTLEEVRPDFCRLCLPFRPALRTAADIVHGGAIATLVDSAAVAAVWSAAPATATGGATADLTVNYLAAAHAVDLTAEARVMRRGRGLVFVEIDVTTPGGERVAKGVLTYKLGYGSVSDERVG